MVDKKNEHDLSMVDFSEVMKDDDTDKRKNDAKNHVNKIIKRKRIIRWLIILILILLVVLYFVSNKSNINEISIKGNKYLTTKQVLKEAGIDYGEKSILHPGFSISSALEKDPLIEDAKVHKTLTGRVTIDVKEHKLVGYYDEKDQTVLVCGDGNLIKIKKGNKQFDNIPYLHIKDKKVLIKLAKALNKLSVEMISDISEIRTYPNNFDEMMVEIFMVDNHVVRTEIKGIYLMKSYNKIIEGLNSNLKCINIMEDTKSAYSANC